MQTDPIDGLDCAFAAWFAGFVDGEGCFFINIWTSPKGQKWSPFLQITLRSDDRLVLEAIKSEYGGYIAEKDNRRTNFTENGQMGLLWRCGSRDGIRKLVDSFVDTLKTKVA